jgi:hypothetical protein
MNQAGATQVVEESPWFIARPESGIVFGDWL